MRGGWPGVLLEHFGSTLDISLVFHKLAVPRLTRGRGEKAAVDSETRRGPASETGAQIRKLAWDRFGNCQSLNSETTDAQFGNCRPTTDWKLAPCKRACGRGGVRVRGLRVGVLRPCKARSLGQVSPRPVLSGERNARRQRASAAVQRVRVGGKARARALRARVPCHPQRIVWPAA